MTIKDLAAITGYAVGTVSRALNDHPNVSDKARATILKAAKEYGFQLNENAKQLKQSSSNNILVIAKGTGIVLFAEMLEYIQNLISKTHYQLVVDYNDEADNEVIRAVQLCREKKPRGLLFLGGNSTNFARDFGKIDVPAVLVTNDASSLHFDNLSSVCTDDTAAAQCAIETLVELGHRRIAVIGGDRKTSDTSCLRYEGCRRAFQAHGIPFDPDRDYQGVRYSYQDGYNAIHALLQAGSQFTAVFACADVMAIGAIRALREVGKRVPEDVSVMGVDGLPLCSFLTPQLSGIRQSINAIALRSVEILLGAIEDGISARHETVPFEVLRRESICAVPETKEK